MLGVLNINATGGGKGLAGRDVEIDVFVEHDGARHLFDGGLCIGGCE